MKCLHRITISRARLDGAIHDFARRQKHTGRRTKVPARRTEEQLDAMLARSGMASPTKKVQPPTTSQRPHRTSAMVMKQIRALGRKGHYKDIDEILDALDRAPKVYHPLPGDDKQGISTAPSVDSVRLPSHIFVHQLLRDNKPVRAARKLEWMIEGNMRVRTTTFNATMSTLLSKMPNFTIKNLEQAKEGDLRAQKLDETTVTRPLTADGIKENFCRQAVALLLLARTHGVKREMWMYEKVIDGLMLQGQCVEAALLFEMLAKDWQIQQTLEEVFSTSVSPLSQMISQPKESKLYALYTTLSVSTLPPSSDLLRRILKPVTDMFGRIKTYRYLPTQAVQSSLQAYVILLATLHRRQIPFADISLLIDAISACPFNSRVLKNPVWVVRQAGATPQKVDALTYADEVLEALINDLPKDLPTFPNLEECYDRSAGKPISEDAVGHVGIPLRKLFKQSAVTDLTSLFRLQSPTVQLKLPYIPPILPPLDDASYLNLMIYALYVRQDTSFARTVFVHMTTLRNPVLTPGASVWTTLQNAVTGRAVYGEPRSKDGSKDRRSWRTDVDMSVEQVDEILGRVVTGAEKNKMLNLSNASQAGSGT